MEGGEHKYSERHKQHMRRIKRSKISLPDKIWAESPGHDEIEQEYKRHRKYKKQEAKELRRVEKERRKARKRAYAQMTPLDAELNELSPPGGGERRPHYDGTVEDMDKMLAGDLKRVPRREREVWKDPIDKEQGPFVGMPKEEVAELERVGYVLSGRRRRPLRDPKPTEYEKERMTAEERRALAAHKQRTTAGEEHEAGVVRLFRDIISPSRRRNDSGGADARRGVQGAGRGGGWQDDLSRAY